MPKVGGKSYSYTKSGMAKAKAEAKRKYKVYPSAYANGYASKRYKEMGGKWK